MNKWRLPSSLKLGEDDFAIRTDFRIVLGIFRVLNSDEYDDFEKWSIAIKAFYVDENVPDVVDAIDKMLQFFGCGAENKESEKRAPKLMDWDQDADLIIPAINKVAGFDIRGADHLHWWTFMSYYMSIGECTFSTVVTIRKKMTYGEKLEQYEKEFFRDNMGLVVLKDAERIRQDEEDKRLLAEIGL